jgi:hypothetical protein
VHRLFYTLKERPDALLAKDKQDIVSCYTLSLIFKKFRSAERYKQWCDIALKNGDGGKSVVKTRFYALFTTGSGYANCLWDLFHKMLYTQLKNVDDELADEMIASFAKLCFTSPNGMLTNSYQTCTRTSKETQQTVVNGKVKNILREVKRKGQLVPKLSLNRAPLKQAEMEALQPVIDKFNDFESVLSDVVRKLDDVHNEFKVAIAAKTVANFAYSKTSIFRKLIKSRKEAIRLKITTSAENNKVNQSTWLTAQTIILKDAQDVDVNSLNLVWDVEQLVNSVKEVVNRMK